MRILGIDTSCDETAAAVVVDGKAVLSNVVWSQVAIHHPYGGVVPELASRKHVDKIVQVVAEALQQSRADGRSLDALAVTQGPGLVGALLVGMSFAKAFAYAQGLPMVGVNHLEAHVAAVYLGPDPPAFPFVALLASGGHTNLYYVTEYTELEPMGQTRDDAAGEAFDKVAKVLGLGYPGGGVIDELAKKGDPGLLRFPRAWLGESSFDFSFSGVKTAVARYVERQGNRGALQLEDVVAGFQEAVVDVLVGKAWAALEKKGCDNLAVVGGVARNRRLRDRLREEASRTGVTVHIPSPDLCSDNAAMVAVAGFHRLKEDGPRGLQLDVFSKTSRTSAASPSARGRKAQVIGDR